MLTRELAISKIDRRTIQPDRLTKSTHAEYVELASKMVAVYSEGTGLTRKTLHSRIRELFSYVSHATKAPCPPKRIDAFCKLLDERCEYQTDSRGESAKLRREVFRLAASFQPLTMESRSLHATLASAAKEKIAVELKRSWEEIEARLFLDLPENHKLQSFRPFESPLGLLARYNVAQTQAVLYDAVNLTVYARNDLKEVVRYAKLARLMHRIEQDGEGYRIHLDGPASLLHRTTRYGLAMAKFLPGLLACRDWSAVAVIQKRKWGQLEWRLDCNCKLTSETPPANEFDSKLEKQLFSEWKPSETCEWTLERESRILHHGQQVFVPDFEARHVSGTRVLIEIVGYWTPEYLTHKQQVLHLFRDQKIVLLVQSDTRKKIETSFQQPVQYYKSKIIVPELLSLLNRFLPQPMD